MGVLLAASIPFVILVTITTVIQIKKHIHSHNRRKFPHKNKMLKKWDESDKLEWLKKQSIRRSYRSEVLDKLDRSRNNFDVDQYGSLSYLGLNTQITGNSSGEGTKSLPDGNTPSEANTSSNYSLFAVRSKNWDASKKSTILITGGVHGYETSGVQGALRFLETEATHYSKVFNILVVPCISPWGYETINRWNQYAVDPNRSFNKPEKDTEGSTEEARMLIQYLSSIGLLVREDETESGYSNNDDHTTATGQENEKEAVEVPTSIFRASQKATVSNTPFRVLAHFDLHETTDTDRTVFMPETSARDGVVHNDEAYLIPDGFYIVGDEGKPAAGFHEAMIESVARITPIAPADENGKILEVPLAQRGVLYIPAKKVGTCMSNLAPTAKYVATTEVYPDSINLLVDDENCIQAQVAAITGGLNYIMLTESQAIANNNNNSKNDDADGHNDDYNEDSTIDDIGKTPLEQEIVEG